MQSQPTGKETKTNTQSKEPFSTTILNQCCAGDMFDNRKEVYKHFWSHEFVKAQTFECVTHAANMAYHPGGVLQWRRDIAIVGATFIRVGLLICCPIVI